MKKLFLLLTIIFFAVPAICEEDEILSRRDAYTNISQSNTNQHKVCTALVKNFRPDSQFSTYLRNRCNLFEADRERLLGILFPYPNHREDGYNEKYPTYVANYSSALNKQELLQLKTLVNEYCKHNEWKFAKKDPQACTETRINSFFN